MAVNHGIISGDTDPAEVRLLGNELLAAFARLQGRQPSTVAADNISRPPTIASALLCELYANANDNAMEADVFASPKAAKTCTSTQVQNFVSAYDAFSSAM